MEIEKIKILLDNGRKVILKDPEKIVHYDALRSVSVVTGTREVITGYVKNIDEDGTIVFTNGKTANMDHLIGWYYE